MAPIFYGAYVLRNLSSEAQQNIIIKHNLGSGTRKNHYQNEGQTKIYGGNAVWYKYEIVDLSCLGIFERCGRLAK